MGWEAGWQGLEEPRPEWLTVVADGLRPQLLSMWAVTAWHLASPRVGDPREQEAAVFHDLD